MYRIVTVEREYGCGAGQIARKLATQLGWKLWDQELTAEIARVANVEPSAVSMCEERVDSAFQQLVKVFWRGSYERRAELEHQPFSPDRMVEVGEQVMREIAEQGNCVIVGRGAPYFGGVDISCASAKMFFTFFSTPAGVTSCVVYRS